MTDGVRQEVRRRDRPSADYLSLVATGPRDLQRVMLRGERPDPTNLVGWEYRGTNLPARTALLGLRRFIKGFRCDESGLPIGYNKSVDGADLGTPWTPRPQRDGRLEFAPYTVATVDPEAVDNRYLHALFLDYGAVPDPERGVAGRLRDYVVRVEPGSDELLLGRAFAAVGRVRVPIGWFVIERLQPVTPTEVGESSDSGVVVVEDDRLRRSPYRQHRQR